MKFKNLLGVLMIGQLVASSISERRDVAAIRSINSVREITADLPDNMSGMLVVCDADETIGRVCCMANNYEYGRQHEAVLENHGMASFFALTDEEKANLFREFDGLSVDHKTILANEYFIHTKKLFVEQKPEERLMFYILRKAERALTSIPHAYSLTEPGWQEFLQTVRARGGKTIIVSSRKFDHHKKPIDKVEPARVAFFESLGFSKADMLYAGRECNYNKATRILKYMSDAKRDDSGVNFSKFMFFDNLRAHCEEVINSKLLRENGCVCQAFEHNAYLNYVTANAHLVLPVQFRAAALNGVRLTDMEILAVAQRQAANVDVIFH